MRWALLLGLLLAPIQAWAQIGLPAGQAQLYPHVASVPALVQNNHASLPLNSAASYSGTVTFGAGVTSGNQIVVGIIFRDATGSSHTTFTIAITGTAVGSCTQDATSFIFDSSPRQHAAYLYHCSVSAGGTTVIVSVTNGVSGKGGAIFAYEASGIAGTPTATPSGTCTGGSCGVQTTTSSQSFTGSPLLVGIADVNNANTDLTCQEAGYTTVHEDTANDDFAACYAVGGVTSPTLFKMKQASGTSNGWDTLGGVYH